MDKVRYEVVVMDRRSALWSMSDVCACCGREGLKVTVPVRRRGGAGDVVWMGTGCAARACGMGIKEYRAAVEKLEAQARTEVQKAADIEMARWKGWLFSQTGLEDVFLAIQVLGGYPAARAAYKEANPPAP